MFGTYVFVHNLCTVAQCTDKVLTILSTTYIYTYRYVAILSLTKIYYYYNNNNIIATDSSSRDNSSSGSSIPVIFGVVGGIFLLLITVLSAAIIYFKCIQRKGTSELENSLQESKLVAHFATTVIIDMMFTYVDNKMDEHQPAYLEVIYDSVEAEQKSCEVCK